MTKMPVSNRRTDTTPTAEGAIMSLIQSARMNGHDPCAYAMA